MFKRVMVPLDGSKLAECALPYAEQLAKGCGSEIILFSVTERKQAQRVIEDKSQPLGYHLAPEAVGKKEKQAQRYLDRIAKDLQEKEIKVRTEVELWEPAEAIVAYAEADKCDVIAMASHGRSGVSRWTHGSVAEKVFRNSCVPVLMIKAPGSVPGVK